MVSQNLVGVRQPACFVDVRDVIGNIGVERFSSTLLSLRCLLCC